MEQDLRCQVTGCDGQYNWQPPKVFQTGQSQVGRLGQWVCGKRADHTKPAGWNPPAKTR